MPKQATEQERSDFWNMTRELDADGAIARASLSDPAFLREISQAAVRHQRRSAWAQEAAVERTHPLVDLMEMVRAWPDILEIVDGAKAFDLALLNARDRVARFEHEREDNRNMRLVVVPYAHTALDTARYAAARIESEHAKRLASVTEPHLAPVHARKLGRASLHASAFDRFERDQSEKILDSENPVFQFGYSGGVVPRYGELRIEVIDFGAYADARYIAPTGRFTGRYEPNLVPADPMFAHAGVLCALAQYPKSTLCVAEMGSAPKDESGRERLRGSTTHIPLQLIRGFRSLIYGSRPDDEDRRNVDCPQWVRHRRSDTWHTAVPILCTCNRGEFVNWMAVDPKDPSYGMSDDHMVATPVRLWETELP